MVMVMVMAIVIVIVIVIMIVMVMVMVMVRRRMKMMIKIGSSVVCVCGSLSPVCSPLTGGLGLLKRRTDASLIWCWILKKILTGRSTTFSVVWYRH